MDCWLCEISGMLAILCTVDFRMAVQNAKLMANGVTLQQMINGVTSEQMETLKSLRTSIAPSTV